MSEEYSEEERVEKVVEFIEGVRFKFNGQFKKIWVEKLKPISVEELPPPSVEFNPNRPVLNFRLYHEDEPNKDVTEFSGTIHLTTYFLQEDFDSADSDLGKLDLGLYDGRKWISFKAKENLDKKLDNTIKPWKGYGTAIIKDKLPDPMLAWGP